ncbi:MAG: AbrB/MazE/SpoVT family DNA-binding domain-containing protein [Chloroflexi bacterium]|nr:AbrB/MazE/SpoVT family DNA-binding domain-containing protein [Chloroflexota bacterium]
MKEFDTMTVTKVGQGTLPKWWRDASGLSHGGVVEIRLTRDGRNSILLTPKPAKRRGAVGLLAHLRRCPRPIPPPPRHYLLSR